MHTAGHATYRPMRKSGKRGARIQRRTDNLMVVYRTRDGNRIKFLPSKAALWHCHRCSSNHES
ncbi:hypothetical protein MPTK1_3g14620 [Marchantia polymorpha subsp. ruderalis]|uniref:Uncharacterized protein n=2 Tax=Marchantia polymorpha TaxID=3197 RepID=A0AAF6B0T9_MARPO|nr:hypothetical protein MARPO_0004s0209 [Marchantia polymorpha]BBN05623.1 hypothetical protein Mp_3g14620 [Marchantia polymorpha subsp. ruderalis]|eukprot:PTQ48959.1 hypothetical protein MARPO_0004s0209 [Marchantia polymorpha]